LVVRRVAVDFFGAAAPDDFAVLALAVLALVLAAFVDFEAVDFAVDAFDPVDLVVADFAVVDLAVLALLVPVLAVLALPVPVFAVLALAVLAFEAVDFAVPAFEAVDFDAVDFEAVPFEAVDFEAVLAAPVVLALVVLALVVLAFEAVDFEAVLAAPVVLALVVLAFAVLAFEAVPRLLVEALVPAVFALPVVVFVVAVRPAVRVAVVPAFVAVARGSLRVPPTTSLNWVPGRKAGTLVFLTFTASPVRGFRAVRAARARFSKTPKPVMLTFSPLLTLRTMRSTTPSTAWLAVFLSPRRSARASMSWALFTLGPSQDNNGPVGPTQRHGKSPNSQMPFATPHFFVGAWANPGTSAAVGPLVARYSVVDPRPRFSFAAGKNAAAGGLRGTRLSRRSWSA